MSSRQQWQQWLFFPRTLISFSFINYLILDLILVARSRMLLHSNSILVPNRLGLICLPSLKYSRFAFQGKGIVLLLRIEMSVLIFLLLFALEYRKRISLNIKLLPLSSRYLFSCDNLLFPGICCLDPDLQMKNGMCYVLKLN